MSEKKKIIFDLEEFKNLVNWIERSDSTMIQSELRKLNFKIVKENLTQGIDKEKLLKWISQIDANNYRVFSVISELKAWINMNDVKENLHEDIFNNKICNACIVNPGLSRLLKGKEVDEKCF